MDRSWRLLIHGIKHDVLGFMIQAPVYRGFSPPGTEEEQTMTISIHASAFDVNSWYQKSP